MGRTRRRSGQIRPSLRPWALVSTKRRTSSLIARSSLGSSWSVSAKKKRQVQGKGKETQKSITG